MKPARDQPHSADQPIAEDDQLSHDPYHTIDSTPARTKSPSNRKTKPEAGSRPTQAQPPSGRFQPGTKIDRYQLIKCIGRGGMGEVYLAQHLRLTSRFYAIKFIKSDFYDPELQQRFETEIDAMERLHHPNIVFAEDAGEHAGVAYLVTEYVDGQDLSSIASMHRRLSVADAAEVIRQTALGLQHAHEKSLVHRDLKPANLVLSKDGTVKILDLGLARFIEPVVERHLTGTLQLLGTPDYMSPEQCRSSESIDIRSDIYSLGCTLYCLLCGHPPFEDESHPSVATKLAAHISEPPTPLAKLLTAELPTQLAAIVSRMLEKDPAARFQTPAELCTAIAPLAQGSNLARLLDLDTILELPQSAQTGIETQPTHTSTTWQGSAQKKSSILRRLALPLLSLIGLLAVGMLGVAYWNSTSESLIQSSVPALSDADPNSPNENQPIALQTPAPAIADSTLVAVSDPIADDVPPKSQVPAAAVDQALAHQGYAFLESYCIKCHGDDHSYPGLDMRDRATLLAPADAAEAAFLVAGDLEQSRLWQMVEREEMPPEGQPQPSHDEVSIFRQWVLAGAVFPLAVREVRQFVGERTILETIDKDLQTLDAATRPYTRYFSLTHLWNDLDVSDEQLRLARAAVSKLLNSLSNESRIVVPQLLAPDGLLMRIDLRDYGWTNEQQWLSCLQQYPWGIKLDDPYADRIVADTGCELCYVRADWFVATASRPPLYHNLVTLPNQAVGIPDELGQFERQLNLNIRENIEQGRVSRAGFSGPKSGISDHNRIVERHASSFGYLWASYDSSSDLGRQNFANFPLGPAALDATNLKAFVHDGGEFIASLPNGMQVYMLATADGKRIDQGPQTIVRDPNQFSGSFDVVNAISCIGCHRHGLLRFTDTIRAQWVDRGDETVADKVLALFPPQAELDALVAADRRRFLDALQLACGELLHDATEGSGSAGGRSIEDYPEPVTSTARYYNQSLKLSDVARELGLPTELATAQAARIGTTADQLEAVIRFNEQLKRHGLLPLTLNDSITREQWEKAFPATVRELNLGQFQMIR